LGAMCRVDPGELRERMLGQVLDQLRTRERLRETRGAKILRHLCDLLDSRATYITLARLLRIPSPSAGEAGASASESVAGPRQMASASMFDRRFINLMVDTLSLLLLTAPELVDLREELRRRVPAA